MNQDSKPTSAAEVTPAQIEAWKKQYPAGVFKLTVEDKTGYVRVPGRNDLKTILALHGQSGRLTMNEALLEEIWLGGDKEILEVDEYWMGACYQIDELIKVKTAELEKC